METWTNDQKVAFVRIRGWRGEPALFVPSQWVELLAGDLAAWGEASPSSLDTNENGRTA